MHLLFLITSVRFANVGNATSHLHYCHCCASPPRASRTVFQK
ncbi:hypothetical protein [Methanimicrococcus blatticola]|nr:hypothetical protein [Methanimicrococcus blatticola]